MDPLSQGTLGAVLPQSVARSDRAGLAFFCGLLGGLAPDLDVFIRSSHDPLMSLEFHRQFTHSLIFIPLGALLVSLAIWLLLGRGRAWPFALVFLFTSLGYATHALLDACTSYGTLLFWPFSYQRVAWNNISIVDPLLTVPLVIAVVTSRLRRRRWPAVLGLSWVVCYLCLGAVFHADAQAIGRSLANHRGHQPNFIDAKPSFANIVLWKTIYRHEDRYYVDAIHVLGDPMVYEGDSVPALELSRDFPWLSPDSVQANDVSRFAWFSDGYLAVDPEHPDRIMDMRYSLLPNEIRPLWSIELDPRRTADQHIRYLTQRERASQAWPQLWAMITRQRLPQIE